MNADDLPLFRWTPPPKVLPFPCARRVGKVRRVVEVLLDKAENPKAAQAYWRRTVSDIDRQLKKAGIAECLIEAEIQEFTAACRCEWRSVRGVETFPYGFL